MAVPPGRRGPFRRRDLRKITPPETEPFVMLNAARARRMVRDRVFGERKRMSRMEPGLPGPDRIEIANGVVQVGAETVAAGLGVDAAMVPAYMREGKITSLYERGVGDDSGRHRLTFFFANRRLRLILDGRGNVLQRSVLDYGDRPLPPGLRR
jgi:hypothetical protein